MNTFERARELGWLSDATYRSFVDGNTYTPEQYAPNWEVQA